MNWSNLFLVLILNLEGSFIVLGQSPGTDYYDPDLGPGHGHGPDPPFDPNTVDPHELIGYQFGIDRIGPGRPKKQMPPPTNFIKPKCGKALDVDFEGIVQFNLHDMAGNAKNECSLALVGSRFFNCTTNIICTDLETFPRIDDRCGDGFIEIGDGLGGEIVGCGSPDDLQLNRPVKSTKDGKDLYLTWKGVIGESSSCQVYCAEDKRFYSHLANLEARELLPSRKKKRKVDSCVCGKKGAQGRIVGGKNAAPFEFPWIGGIVRSEESRAKIQARHNVTISTRLSMCGASLISDRHAITAAHCFSSPQNDPDRLPNPGDFEVAFHAHILEQSVIPKEFAGPNGTALTSEEYQKKLEKIPGYNESIKSDEDESTIRVRVHKIIRHPLWNNHNFDYDIAILQFKDKVNFKRYSDLVRPVCLSPPGTWIPPKEKDILEIVGWGLNDEHALGESRILQKAQVPVVNWRLCLDITEGFVNSRLMCAGFEKGGVDACQGDSGSAALSMRGNQWYQAGVVSSGEGCARPYIPGYYTNMNEVLQWAQYVSRNGKRCKYSEDEPAEQDFTEEDDASQPKGFGSDTEIEAADVADITEATTEIEAEPEEAKDER